MTFDERDRDNTVALTIEGTAQYYVQRYHLPATAPELADCIRTDNGDIQPLEALILENWEIQK
jgi:hypothetical protein